MYDDEGNFRRFTRPPNVLAEDSAGNWERHSVRLYKNRGNG